jgi:hypothetical protein
VPPPRMTTSNFSACGFLNGWEGKVFSMLSMRFFLGDHVSFQGYCWPGNIRELQNLVEPAVILLRDGVLPNPWHKSKQSS